MEKNCMTCKSRLRNGYPCTKCDENYLMWEEEKSTVDLKMEFEKETGLKLEIAPIPVNWCEFIDWLINKVEDSYKQGVTTQSYIKQ